MRKETRRDPIELSPGCDLRESKVKGLTVVINAAAQTRMIVNGGTATISVTIPWNAVMGAVARNAQLSNDPPKSTQ